jgi:hypothetical protein
LIQERVGNTLELVGIGKNFLNETPAAQQLRDSKNAEISNSFSLKSLTSSSLFNVALLAYNTSCS